MKLFVTGTDTGVGKTTVSCQLLKEARATGLSTLGLKPIASGATNGINSDAVLLRAQSTIQLPYAAHNPIVYDEEIAPHIAAEQRGECIDFDDILNQMKGHLTQADYTIIEGAGGWLVPINDQYTFADLAKGLNIPVILVVGIRLGCINHALLTASAIRQSGCQIEGWVANCIEEKMPYLESNISSINQRIGCPLLSIVGHHYAVYG